MTDIITYIGKLPPPGHQLGVDLPFTLAAVDACYDEEALEMAATKIVEVFHALVVDPATPQGDVPGCVPLRLVRRALSHQPRELFDAAIRWLDALDEPPVEVSLLDRPGPSDIAEGVLLADATGDLYIATQLGLIEEL